MLLQAEQDHCPQWLRWGQLYFKEIKVYHSHKVTCTFMIAYVGHGCHGKLMPHELLKQK